MKILIDECVPRPIKRFLRTHNAQTVQELGLSSYSNGKLIEIADGQFDLFITSDQNLRYQQNLSGRRLAILMLSTNDWDILKEAGEAIAEAIEKVGGGEFFEL